MASVDAVAKFITDLGVHFRIRIYEPNKEAKEKAWYKSIAHALDYYDDGMIERAAQRIKDTRKVDTFPLPAEIRKIFEEILREDRPRHLVTSGSSSRSSPSSRDRITFVVTELLRGPMGRQACEEGWIGPLYEEARRRNALPRDHEIRGLKIRAEEFHRLREQCHRVEGWNERNPHAALHARGLAALGDSMHRKYELVADVVLNRRPVEDLFLAMPREEFAA